MERAEAIPPAATTGTETASSTSASKEGVRPFRERGLRLDSLGDHEVAARLGGAPCLLDRADLPAERSTRVHMRHELRIRIGPEELDESSPGGGELDLLPLALAERGHEVDAERARLGVLDLRDALGERARASSLEHPQTAGTADRDDELRGRYSATHRRELDR